MLNLITNLPNHLKVTISAWIARGIIAITNLIAIRFLLPYLGTESYAVYLILLSFTSWCALTDFGIGTALQNYISEFRVKKIDYQPYINSAFQIIICFTLIAIMLSLVLYQPIQNFILKKYTDILNIQTINVVLASLILLILIGVVNISTKIYYALQKGVIPNILTSIAYIISFCAMLIVINTQSENNKILKIILCYTLPQIVLIGFLFFKIFKNSIKNIFKVNKDILKVLLDRTIKFGLITIIGLMNYEIDYFIMAKTVSPTDITVYSVFAKIFLAVFSIYSSLLIAFWPLCAERYHRKEYKEIKEHINRYLIFGISLLSVSIIILYLFKDLIFSILLQNISYNLSYTFFIVAIIYFIFRTIGDTYTIFLQSTNHTKIFITFISIQTFINIYLQYYFSLKFGITGIFLGLALSYLFTQTLFFPYISYRILRN